MRLIGITATAAVAALAATAVLVGVRSMPDIQRYLKMRAM
jgi:hypothetical protein